MNNINAAEMQEKLCAIKHASYEKLFKLAELCEEDKQADDCLTMKHALTKVLKYGNEHEFVEALDCFLTYAYSLELISLLK